MIIRFASIAIAAFMIAACASGNAAAPPTTAKPATGAAATTAPALTLQSESGDSPLADLVARQDLTVLLFFTAECPVQKAHDARTRELVTAYGSRGVSFVAVVSEVGAKMSEEREEAKKRAIGIPVLEDRNAVLADALGVEYSTHAVLLSKDRKVLYSGAFDADRVRLKDDSERYLKNAIDAALAGKPIDKPRTEALGCALRKR